VRTGIFLSLVGVCFGCAAPRPTATATTTPTATAAPYGLRLPADVVPRAESLDLEVDPDREDYRGSVAIEVDLRAPARTVWLHARNLVVEGAEVGDQAATLAPAPDDQHLGLTVARAVGPGPATLHIRFRGKMNPTERGVFRKRAGDAWYAYTYMEPLYAREAWPCFDEPAFKIPWRVTLRVPKGLVAAGNAPIASEADEGDRHVVRFEPTRPLPSYLVAFTVGPFDVVDAGRTAGGAPIRILTPRGRASEAAFPKQALPPIVAALERYFGMPYPYAKLDWVSMPAVNYAEENPGLITSAEVFLLAAPEADTESHRRFTGREIFAHEMAHMWFGDFVTSAWWDDIWLNEAFATWMQARVVGDWQPGWGADVDQAQHTSRALELDGMASARAIRQPIATDDDITNAFDSITYQKGAAVLGMFEAWLGRDAFRDAVRAYLAAHADGSATSAQLFATLDATTGKDVARALATFTDQSGAPRLSVDLACAPGARPTVRLTQERSVVAGSTAEPHVWTFPVCLRTSAGRTCTVLDAPSAELPLEGACPAWIEPNADGVGYYVSLLQGPLLNALLAHVDALTAPERYRLLDDLIVNVNAGALPVGEALAALPALHPASAWRDAALAWQLLDLVRTRIVPARLLPAHAALVRAVFAARAHSLGLTPRPGESFDDAQVRVTALAAAALDGEDPALVAEAHRLALAWLDDPKAVGPDVASTALVVAARHADRALFERLKQAATQRPDELQRRLATTGLANVRDPQLVDAALAMTLDETLEARRRWRILTFLGANEVTGPQTFAWTRTHYAELEAKLPKPSWVQFLNVGTYACEPTAIAEYEAFFKEKVAAMEGGTRAFAQEVEDMKSCVALRKAQEASAVRFYEKAQHP
jgi:alanyl aminopeptidase